MFYACLIDKIAFGWHGLGSHINSKFKLTSRTYYSK